MLTFVSRALIALGLVLVLLATTAPQPAVTEGAGDGAQAAAQPILTITPERGSCSSQFVAQGQQFPPGEAVTLVVRPTPPARSDNFPTLSGTAAADGTLTIEIPLFAIYCLPNQPQPPGERGYEVLAVIGFEGVQPGTTVATATFTVAPPSSSLPGLPNTGSGAQGQVLLPIGPLITGGLVAVLSSVALCYLHRQRRAR